MDKKEAAKIFGENLRKIRTEKGMSQAELASKLGYNSRSSINKIEIGDRDMPRSKIVQMARILDVSPVVFFKNEPIDADEVAEKIVDQELTMLIDGYQNLNEKNRMKLSVYIQALIDSQEGD